MIDAMARLTLQRTSQTAKATLGQLRLGPQIIAVTLEDPPQEGPGPIPAGVYRIRLSYSGRFQALLPELLNVPGRTGIRIHAGNTPADTTGCILLGRYQSGDAEVAESRVTLGLLLARWPEWHDTDVEVVDA